MNASFYFTVKTALAIVIPSCDPSHLNWASAIRMVVPLSSLALADKTCEGLEQLKVLTSLELTD